MKKNFKKLRLNKSTLSNLDASKVSGGLLQTHYKACGGNISMQFDAEGNCQMFNPKETIKGCQLELPTKAKTCKNTRRTFCGPHAC